MKLKKTNHPLIFTYCQQKKIGIPPSQCIAFEDTVSGVKAAKSAGTTVIAIPSKGVDVKEIAKYSDKVYKSFSEIKVEDLISLSL
jgi:beta-phosphoglucomutase-like phosphatase (HAD superfamily)